MNWDQYFMSMVYLVAMKSKDKSSHIGAVIVGDNHEIISTGYNGLPRGCNDNVPERDERPAKYNWYEHGERNSIYNAARIGVSTEGKTMYTTGIPCINCARGVINAGIKKVVTDYAWDERDTTSGTRVKWHEEAQISKQMFEEAGVVLEQYKGPKVTELTGLFSGKEIKLG